MQTMAVIVDVANLYFCIGKAYVGRKLDYGKYLDQASGENALYRTYAFGTKKNKETYSFISCLRHLGYETRFITYQPRINNNVAMSCEIFRIASKLDILVLGSSDPNLVPLVEWVKDQGVQVVIFACGIPSVLREVASKCIEINEDLLENVITETTE